MAIEKSDFQFEKKRLKDTKTWIQKEIHLADENDNELKKKIAELKKESRGRYSEELETPSNNITTIYKGRGCNVCNYTGYNGQVGVFECVEITDELEEAIVRNPDKKALTSIIRATNVKTMFEDGLNKVRQGLTTIEEINRVIGNAKS